MTTPRTLALVTRLRALDPTFKPEWWDQFYYCKWNRDSNDGPDYIGPPDLSAPECLAELFEVCRKLLSKEGILRTSFCDETHRAEIETVKDGEWVGFIGCSHTNLSLALLAAAEAALGAGGEVAGG